MPPITKIPSFGAADDVSPSAAITGAAPASPRQLKSALLAKIDLAGAESADSSGSGLIPAFRANSKTAGSKSSACSDGSKSAATSSSCASGSSFTAASSGSAGAGEPAVAAAVKSLASATIAATPVTSTAAPAATAAAPRPRGRGTKLLALCPTVPPSMQRDVWCIADYEIVQKLYTGYASKGGCAAVAAGRGCGRSRQRWVSIGAAAGWAFGSPP
jgi:hypothetical protein